VVRDRGALTVPLFYSNKILLPLQLGRLKFDSSDLEAQLANKVLTGVM
jgi:hypothetical protein